MTEVYTRLIVATKTLYYYYTSVSKMRFDDTLRREYRPKLLNELRDTAGDS